MADRLSLQALFESILGSENVYFQPPAKHNMKYPAIRYNLSDIKSGHADDMPYMQTRGYEATLIDYNPDSSFVDKISKLPNCSFSRFYATDGLNHWVFKLFH